MRSVRRILLLGVVVGLLGGPAVAGHIGLPIKWSQLPDMGATGVDIRAEHPLPSGGQVVADDWECTDPRPVIAVRWWGSYLDATYEPTATRHLPFELSFHTGDTTSPPDSTPGPYIKQFVSAQEHFFGVDGVGMGNNVYEYNAYLPDPFEQIVGDVYWLDVELDIGALGWPMNTWGWHNTDMPWRDTAVSSTQTHGGAWVKLDEDMAFELMVVPEPLTGLGMLMAIAGLGRYIQRRRKGAV